jgi:hypothetical protein
MVGCHEGRYVTPKHRVPSQVMITSTTCIAPSSDSVPHILTVVGDEGDGQHLSLISSYRLDDSVPHTPSNDLLPHTDQSPLSRLYHSR